MKSRLSIVLAALWWGSLTGLGFVVVPMLFAHLPSPAMAGAMAAKLFTAQTWLSIGCSFLLLLVLNRNRASALFQPAQAAIKYVVAGLLFAVLVEFGVAPNIVNARASSGDLRFWHGLGSAMYVAQWLAASWTLWVLGRAAKESETG